MFVFLLKLLFRLMLMSLCPQPQPQHEPPQIAAPHAMPMPKEIRAVPG